jgi:predicted nuclease with RNAse H fold
MTAPRAWYIGWDVGAWNCEKNANSRDALVVLNQQGELVGKPWRGNLRDTIAAAASYTDWLFALAKLCQFDDATKAAFTTQNVVMAIDTPLGFSNGLLQLLQGEAVATPFTASSDNPYLYRHTERELFAHGFSPLSAVKDMIGSQATKGLHLLRKFGFTPSPNGIWQLNQSSQSSQNQCQHHALESYPTVLKTSNTVQQYIQQLSSQTNFNNWHQDIQDAAYCAIAALLYQQQPNTMATPTDDVTTEGWIYVPKECLTCVRKR